MNTLHTRGALLCLQERDVLMPEMQGHGEGLNAWPGRCRLWPSDPPLSTLTPQLPATPPAPAQEHMGLPFPLGLNF